MLELLADALAVGGDDRRERVGNAVAALPDDAWRLPVKPSPPPAEPPGEPPPKPDPIRIDDDEEQVERDEIYFSPDPPRSRRRAWLAALALLAVVVALIVIIAGGGDDDEPSEPAENGSRPAQNDGGEAEGRTEPLVTLRGGRGEGRVAVTDEGATVTLRGLPNPDGTYQVWLYDSIVDAQSLGTIESGSGRLEVRLPPDARSYRFIDVSNEPADENPNHSGASVLRAPLRELLR